MKKYQKNKEYDKNRSIRLSDKTWEEFQLLRQEGVSWEFFVKDLLNLIKQFQKFGKK